METPSECGYVQSNGQSVRCAIYSPSANSRRAVLICDPLFEERRCAMRTSVRMADRLSEAGFTAVRFDYSGTGDSSGIHSEATAGQWINEIRSVAEECLSRCPELHIVALRASSLLAAAANIPCSRMTFVAPVKSGKELLHQMELRNRLKAEMGGLKQEDSMDFGGFALSRKNYDEISALDLFKDCITLPEKTLLDIIMVGAGKALPQAWIPLQQRAANVVFIRDMPFWGQTDYFESNNLIDEIVRSATGE